MHGFRKLKPKALLHNKGRAAFAGLTVNADNRLILAAYVGRVNGQIRNFPVRRSACFHVGRPFVDRVLVGTGKRGEHQVARIRVAFVNVHPGAFFKHSADLTHA